MKAKKTPHVGRRVLLILLILTAVGTLSLLGIDHHVRSSVSDRILSAEEAFSLDADCILVLGAGVRGEGRPSPMLEDRLLKGIELYQSGASDRMLMSGDHGQTDYDEVNTMKAYAVIEGVPSEHVFMDHAGFSTYESMYRARDVFGAKKVLIVTQEYHLYRAVYDAQALGLDAYGVAADRREYRGQIWRDFREVLARGKDFFYGMTQPAPTYLGEAIPISGNGDVTNDR